MDHRRSLTPVLGLALGLALGSLALGAAVPAQAQPTAKQAEAIEGQITTWLRSASAGLLTLPPRPVELTPEGDHYLVRIPLAPLGKVDPPDAAFTGKAHPLDGTRWALDDQQWPPNLTLRTTETVLDTPDGKTKGAITSHKESVTYRIKLGQQDAHGVFDPAFATPTLSSGTIASIDIEKEGGTAASLTHAGLVTSQSTMQPDDNAHADLLTDVVLNDYSTKSALPDGSAFALQAGRMHVVSAMSAVAHDQIIPLLHMVAELVQMPEPAGGGGASGPTPQQKARLHAMLERAHGLLTGAKIDETMEDAKFQIAGRGGALSKVELTFNGDAPADMLSASFGLTLDGLVLDALPPALAAYVPSHIAIRPTLSNLSLSTLTRMGLAATAPVPAGQKATAPPADVGALFRQGGIRFGFDTLAFDVAGLDVTGSGAFTSTSPQSVTGQAELTATGLDALIARVQADPMLQQAAPVAIMLKTMARTSGDKSVWQITVDNAKILVNGVDVSALAGAFSR